MEKVEIPVADALGRAHVALLRDLRELEKALRATSRERPPDVRRRLATTRVLIAEHFRFEEQDGYMDAVRERDPRFGHTIEQLAKQHRQLADALDALIEQADAAETVGHKLRARISEWIHKLRQHEAAENQLVQEAFNLELGPED